MFELVKALNDGAEALRKRVPNPIGLNAGCELFIAFVTLFPHESTVCIRLPHVSRVLHTYILRKSFSALKTELVSQGKKYVSEALTYRSKIAELALGFIKDDSVASIVFFCVDLARYSNARSDIDAFVFPGGYENSASCPQTQANIGLCDGGSTTWARVGSLCRIRAFQRSYLPR